MQLSRQAVAVSALIFPHVESDSLDRWQQVRLIAGSLSFAGLIDAETGTFSLARCGSAVRAQTRRRASTQIQHGWCSRSLCTCFAPAASQHSVLDTKALSESAVSEILRFIEDQPSPSRSHHLAESGLQYQAVPQLMACPTLHQ